MEGYELDISGSEQWPVEGSYESCKETSGSVNYKDALE
jgi:hypothetical protein